MKKLLLMFVAILSMATFARAEEVSFAFTNTAFWGNQSWGSSYSAHSGETDACKIAFTSVSKQSSTINEYPVGKKTDVTLTMKNDVAISSVTFNLKQWSSKNQTANLSYSTDGGLNYTTLSGVGIDADWKVTSDLPEGATSVKLSTTNSSNQVGFVSVEYIVAEASSKADAELSFPEELYQINLGEEFEAPVLSNPHNLAVNYYSSNESVATVDGEGKVTILTAGSTVITAASEMTDEYRFGEASYTLKVIDPNVTGFLLATNQSDIYDGAYVLITDSGKNVAMSSTQGSNNRGTTEINVNENIIDLGEDIPSSSVAVAQLKLNSSDPGQWAICTINGSAGCLYAGNTSSNWLLTSTSATYYANISINAEGIATVMFKNQDTRNQLMYNSTSNPKVFSCYSGTQKDISLFVFQHPVLDAPTVDGKPTSEDKIGVTPGKNSVVKFNVPTGTKLYYKVTYSNGSEAANAPMRAEAGFTLYNDEEGITINNVGTLEYYTVTGGLDSPVKTISIDNTTGLNEIFVEEGEAVYYNLQGVRVANPANGVYIRVMGGKASKVIL